MSNSSERTITTISPIIDKLTQEDKKYRELIHDVNGQLINIRGLSKEFELILNMLKTNYQREEHSIEFSDFFDSCVANDFEPCVELLVKSIERFEVNFERYIEFCTESKNKV